MDIFEPEVAQNQRTSRIIPLSKWNNYHDYPTVGSLRWMVFHNANGIGCCLKRLGKRILIDEAAFFAWIDSQQQA